MLNVKNISFKIAGKQILNRISFSAERGQICAVIGPNGAGKSTLLKTIAGILKPKSGSVYIDGENMTAMRVGERAKHIAYLPQNTDAVPGSVYHSVLLGRKPHMGWYPSKYDYDRTEKVLEFSGLSEFSKKCVTKLSGGEFQKVLIARAIVQESPVLLLDEPVNHLDIKNRLDVMEMTAEITADHNLVSVIVMHDLNLALRYADSILVLDKGEQRTFCSVSDADSGLLSSVYSVPMDIVTHMGKTAALY